MSHKNGTISRPVDQSKISCIPTLLGPWASQTLPLVLEISHFIITKAFFFFFFFLHSLISENNKPKAKIGQILRSVSSIHAYVMTTPMLKSSISILARCQRTLIDHIFISFRY